MAGIVLDHITRPVGILLFVGAWNEYFWPLLVYRNVSHSGLR